MTWVLAVWRSAAHPASRSAPRQAPMRRKKAKDGTGMGIAYSDPTIRHAARPRQLGDKPIWTGDSTRKTRAGPRESRGEVSASVFSPGAYVSAPYHGEVAEWSIAPDSKSGGPKGPGGSNPSLSATSARGETGKPVIKHASFTGMHRLTGGGFA